MSSAPPTTMTSLDYRRATQTEVSGRLAPAVVGILFFAAFVAMEGWPRSVADASLRIGLSCLPAIVIAILADRVPRMSRLLLFGVNVLTVLICIVPAMLPMVRPTDWSWPQLALIAGVIAVATGGITTLTQMLAQRDGTILTLLILIGMTLATAALLVFSHTARLAQLTLPLAAGIIVVLIIGLFFHPLRTSRGISTIVMAILTAQVVSGYLWGSDMPIWAGAAVLGSPLYAWVVRVPFIARRRPWQRILIGLIVAALPAATACVFTGTDYNQGSIGSGGEESPISPASYGSWKPE